MDVADDCGLHPTKPQSRPQARSDAGLSRRLRAFYGRDSGLGLQRAFKKITQILLICVILYYFFIPFLVMVGFGLGNLMGLGPNSYTYWHDLSSKGRGLIHKCASTYSFLEEHWDEVLTFPNRIRLHEGGVVFDWSQHLDSTYVYNQVHAC